MNDEFSTPMMQQYLEIKKQYPDCILFFRLGDFYEMFLDDAKIGASILDITLTSRAKGKDGKVAMAGVPYHAAEGYIAKLINKGLRVAIAEQVSDPSLPGIVKREVVRVISKGTMLGEVDNSKNSHFIVSLVFGKNNFGMAMLDAATGEFRCAQRPLENKMRGLINVLGTLNMVECIISSKVYENIELLSLIKSATDANIFMFREWETVVKKANLLIEKTLGKPLAVWELEVGKDDLAIEATAALLGYLEYAQKRPVAQVRAIKKFGNEGVMRLDRPTMMNLELFETGYEKDSKSALIEVLDDTKTSMGARLLRVWLAGPLVDSELINSRQEAIGRLVSEQPFREEIRNLLINIKDCERMASRLLTGWGNGRDLVGIRESIKSGITLRNILKSETGLLRVQVNRIEGELLGKVVNVLEEKLIDLPPVDIRKGGMIKNGVNLDLDELRLIKNDGKKWIDQFERQERARSGINSLKVKFNQVFGFYIEISKSNLDLVPQNYVRKQTLVNAERYITEELKMHEIKVLEADGLIEKLELEIYEELVQLISENLSAIQEFGRAIGVIDVICCLAEIAVRNRYSRPILVKEKSLKIYEGRHPVIERLKQGQFVPNDVVLDSKINLMVLTGPNMAGKSVFLRQVAILVLMAQIGSFVPVKSMEWSIVDRIFVRSGASDAMGKGLSTFMVEMIETSAILANASSKSLIVMDEIGRGTSTFDGISIAWAIGEYLVGDKWDGGGPLTLFATHYHELQQLANEFSQIANYQVAVVDDKGTPVFLHKVVGGGAPNSYGVAVAKMAGLPELVNARAREVLEILEGKEKRRIQKKTMSVQMAFGIENEPLIVDQLRKIDVNNITPLEALNWLVKAKEKI